MPCRASISSRAMMSMSRSETSKFLCLSTIFTWSTCVKNTIAVKHPSIRRRDDECPEVCQSHHTSKPTRGSAKRSIVNVSAAVGLILIIDVRKLLTVSVAHDVVVRLQFGRPGRGEATRCHLGYAGFFGGRVSLPVTLSKLAYTAVFSPFAASREIVT